MSTGSKRQRNGHTEDFHGVGAGVFHLVRLAAVEVERVARLEFVTCLPPLFSQPLASKTNRGGTRVTFGEASHL